jgi:hypothetical protein
MYTLEDELTAISERIDLFFREKKGGKITEKDKATLEFLDEQKTRTMEKMGAERVRRWRSGREEWVRIDSLVSDDEE